MEPLKISLVEPIRWPEADSQTVEMVDEAREKLIAKVMGKLSEYLHNDTIGIWDMLIPDNDGEELKLSLELEISKSNIVYRKT